MENHYPEPICDGNPTPHDDNRGPEVWAYLMIAAAAFYGTLIAALLLWALS